MARHATMMLSLLAAGLLTFASVAMPSAAKAQSLSGSESDKKSDGQFTGIALITDDPGWYERFQRPETPQITGRDRFGPGESGALAVIFSNATPRQGMVKITCEVTAFDPKGSHALAVSKPCYEGPFAGPNILHPAQLDLRFKMGPDEPAGQAGFKITLHDAYSGREVHLTVSFTQVAGQ
jgi:hypothetical protein